MARAAKANKQSEEPDIGFDLGSPNSDPQWEYFTATNKYICYGGARGGGKSWSTQRKSILLGLNYPGIKMLIIRREYSDMENSIIDPILKVLPTSLYSYNKTDHLLTFSNGSTIKFGNMPGYGAAVAGRYQGQEYDVVFLEEATQFLENEFRGLAAIVRGTNNFPKRMYLTCNPGGVGHFWVKRIFIDRAFRDGEDPKDYKFIKATVDDNKDLMESNPDYVKQLELLPEDIRNAHRHGDWNALSGVFFGEFTDSIHTCKPFPIPPHWKKYRAMDYGLDMFYCIWVAVDENGRCYVYREYYQSNMTVPEAAKQQLLITRPDEQIYYTIAPPDMWSRSNDTGKTRAMTFMENGVTLIRADNNRIAGWSALKNMFMVGEDKKPNLVMFNTCGRLIECIKCLQHDKTHTDDVAKEPHEITHGPDALRYFAQTYVLPAEIKEEEELEEEPGDLMDYQTAMCGSGVSRSYILA